MLSFLTASAAFFALAQGLGIEWMRIVGLAVALLGALVRGLTAIRRSHIEHEREAAELGRRTHVPISPIAMVNPTEVGVDAAIQTILPGEEVPEYVAREVDGDLREAVRAALDGSGRWIVIAVGQSKVGKSRAMFEALRACSQLTDMDFIAPIDGAALRSLITPGETPQTQCDASVLWLDDLEPFINEGVTLQTLREWHNRTPGRSVIVATYGGKGSDKVRGSASEALATIAGEVFQHAREVSLKATNADEVAPLRSHLSRDAVQLIERHGLAAYLVAAPELQRKLNSHRHAMGEPECPEGVAVVQATVDWARCGRTDRLPEKILRDELWPAT